MGFIVNTTKSESIKVYLTTENDYTGWICTDCDRKCFLYLRKQNPPTICASRMEEYNTQDMGAGFTTTDYLAIKVNWKPLLKEETKEKVN